MTNTKKSRLRKRRGVTEVISTMMLMAVTVTGASTLTYFMNDAFVTGSLGSATTLDSSSLNLLLLAYDTRDSSTLLTLNEVDNENSINAFLCGITCSGTTNAIPENGGTEFIVMQLQNNGIDSIFLQDVAINNVKHYWDDTAGGVLLDASVNDLGTSNRNYPADGTFSILPVGSSPIMQNDDTKIESGQAVNVLVKLGPNDSDIELNNGIQVLLNTGNNQPTKFLLESGGAR